MRHRQDNSMWQAKMELVSGKNGRSELGWNDHALNEVITSISPRMTWDYEPMAVLASFEKLEHEKSWSSGGILPSSFSLFIFLRLLTPSNLHHCSRLNYSCLQTDQRPISFWKQPHIQFLFSRCSLKRRAIWGESRCRFYMDLLSWKRTKEEKPLTATERVAVSKPTQLAVTLVY